MHIVAFVEERFLQLGDQPRGLLLGRLVDRKMNIRTEHDRSFSDHVRQQLEFIRGLFEFLPVIVEFDADECHQHIPEDLSWLRR